MAPQPHHRTATFLRALVNAGFLALAWLLLSSASAQADSGRESTILPTSPIHLVPKQPTQVTAAAPTPPVDGRTVSVPVLPAVGAPAGPAYSQVLGTVVAVANELAGEVEATSAPILAQVPPLTALVEPPTLSVLVLPVPKVVAELDASLGLPAGSPPPDQTTLVSPGRVIAPLGGLPISLSAPSIGAATHAYQAANPLLYPQPSAESGRPESAATVAGSGSGLPGPPPVAPPDVSGSTVSPGNRNASSSQMSAEPAYFDLVGGPDHAEGGPGNGWKLPASLTLPPGSSPD